jgi:hypothetical protein
MDNQITIVQGVMSAVFIALGIIVLYYFGILSVEVLAIMAGASLLFAGIIGLLFILLRHYVDKRL